MRKSSHRHKRFREPDRSQQILMTHIDLNSVAPVGSPVWIINDLVDKLDTSEIESTYKVDVLTGRTPIHPKTFIKVSLFAINSCRFSLRKMEYDTRNHLAYRWLTGDISIDHSTLGNFLSFHKNRISKLFSQIVIFAIAENLLDFEILAIDSLKIRASASYKEEKNSEEIEKEREKVETQINNLLKKFEQNEDEEGDESQLNKLNRRKRKLEASL